MHQSKKGNQWHDGMKVHPAPARAQTWSTRSSLPAANAHDLNSGCRAAAWRWGRGWWRAGHQGIARRPEMEGASAAFRVAMRPGKRWALPDTPDGRLQGLAGTAKAQVRAKVEHTPRW